jgi:DNA-binding LacI/PurR family transcriptional regulator
VSLFGRGDRDHPRWYVDVDNVAVGRLASDYLSGKGHERILCVCDHLGSEAQCDRFQGFCEDQRAKGREPLSVRLQGWIEAIADDDPGDADRFMKALEQTRSTAVFAATGGASMATFAYLSDRGVRIPEECSFVGLDVPSGVPLCAEQLMHMTEIICPGEQLGYEAANLLARRIDGDSPEPAGVLIPPELVERRSVAAI